MDRAYSVLEIKSVDEERRELVGLATTPAADRRGDIVEPKGASFSLPLPLLWQHDHAKPIGTVVEATVNNRGILVRAQIPQIAEPGPLKDLIDLAWQLIKAKLVRGLSIGFRALETARLEKGGTHFLKWSWLELSAVTIPANAEATIQVIRSLDSQTLAASGRERERGGERRLSAGVSAQSRSSKGREANSMNTQEQIRSFEASHTAKHERMKAIMQAAADDGVRTLNESEQQEYDDLTAEVAQVAEHLKRLRGLERTVLPAARPVAGGSADDAMTVRGGAIITAGRPQLPKGSAFTRYAIALANGRGSTSDALRFAQRWKDSSPEVLQALEQKADPGTVADATWAAPLAVAPTVASEFVELLRHATVVGRLNLRRVPFNISIPVQTSGSTVNWVGEAAPKPVGELAFTTMTLGYSKVAGIVVISEELARLSNPAAEDLIRRDLIAEIAEFIDLQFLSESVLATANNPAGIAVGVTAIPASGTDANALRCDVQSALQAMLTAGLSTGGVVAVMSEQLGAAIGLMTNALGQPEFGGMGPSGGSIGGIPVITSENVGGDTTGHNIYFIKQSEILLADDGGVTVDSSREATLDMAGTTNAVYSLWQRNAVGIRAERWINYKRRRDGAVQYISNAAYTACGS
jgi:HK97 family phage major capsid protein/HK97 family phage prohead protease